MPREPSRREELKQAIEYAKQSLALLRAEGDPENRDRKIAARRQKIAALEAEIADIQRRFEEAPAKIVRQREHLKKLEAELAKHDNRHDVDRLQKVVQELSRLTPDELKKLREALQ